MISSLLEEEDDGGLLGLLLGWLVMEMGARPERPDMLEDAISLCVACLILCVV